MSLRVNPGPIKEDVFFLADTHRVRALFTNTVADNVELNVKRVKIDDLRSCFITATSNLHKYSQLLEM
ncbi:hypothetical protein R6Q59_024185 [Mikania micrantha]